MCPGPHQRLLAFGSRAAGVNEKHPISTFYAGDGVRRMKGFGLDVVCISSVEMASPNSDSELAGHISKYGIWLKGLGQWRKPSVYWERSGKQKRTKARFSSPQCQAFVATAPSCISIQISFDHSPRVTALNALASCRADSAIARTGCGSASRKIRAGCFASGAAFYPERGRRVYRKDRLDLSLRPRRSCQSPAA